MPHESDDLPRDHPTPTTQSAETLQQNEERFRSLFEAMHEGFAFHEVICDDEGEAIDYRFLDTNPAFERLTGLRREAVIGRTVREIMPGIEEEWIRTFGRVALSGEPAELESYVQELDRYYRARAYSPRRGTFAVVFEDITDQRRAKKELEQREAQLRALFDSSQAGIILVDTSGRITVANARMAEMLGCSPQELVGSSYPEYIHPDERHTGDERMRQLIRGEVDSVGTERHYIRKDGSDFWGFLSGRRHEDADGSLISLVGHITDITELKQVEETLREKEQYLQTIIDASPECIKLLARDGSLIMMNRSGLRMIEAESLAEVQGKCIFCLVTEGDRSKFEALTERVFNGESVTLEFEAVSLHGRPIWMETHAVPFRNSSNVIIALLGLTRDITDQKQVEHALRSSEERFRTLVECSIDVTFVLDAAGVFRFVSPSWQTHFGYPASDVIGREFAPFVHTDDVQPCFDYLHRVMTTRIPATSPPYRVRHADGSWRLFIANGTTFTDPLGNLFYLGIARDLSEQKRAEEERLSLERQLLHVQKLESLGVLAGGIAHDFNNILTAIIGNADIALMRLNPESPALENLHRIEKAAARAADLARQMLAYSGKGKFVVEAIDLNRLVEEMGHMLEVSISKNAVLRYNLTRPLPTVNVDATQIRQIIMNLVINASEAIGDTSGIIDITTGCLECTGDDLKNSWLTDPLPAGLYLILEIADTGCGMGRETLDKVFDPFFTTKFTGRGLGMAAVLGIIRGHKGTIRVKSEPGRGSSFSVLLPAGDRPVEVGNGHQVPDEWRGSGKALLVDDEETVRVIGSEMLRELGFEVVTACDGQEALTLYHHDISVVILDLTMPRVDGEKCFRELRMLDPDVKVIVSSGFSESEVTHKFAGKGVTGFVQKPYKLSTLRDVLKGIITQQPPVTR